MIAAPTISAGDTAWVFVASALVLLMVPGLALFYGGLVRSRAALNTLMMSFGALAVVTVQWTLMGYSLSFAPGAIVGDLRWFGLTGVGAAAGPYSSTIPHVALRGVSGDVRRHHGRAHLGRDGRAHPLSHLSDLRVRLDDVRLRSARALGLGERRLAAQARRARLRRAAPSCTSAPAPRRSSPRRCSAGAARSAARRCARTTSCSRVTGAGLLWVGWLGFNAGSALAADGVAANALATTHAAAAAALIMWLIIDYCAHATGDGGRRGDGRRRRARRDHAGRGIRDAGRRAADRRARVVREPRRDPSAQSHADRRRTRRLRLSRCRRHSRRAAHRRVRDDVRQCRGREWPPIWKCSFAVGAGDRRDCARSASRRR